MKFVIDEVAFKQNWSCIIMHFIFILRIEFQMKSELIIVSEKEYSITAFLIVLPASVVEISSLLTPKCPFAFFNSFLEMT